MEYFSGLEPIIGIAIKSPRPPSKKIRPTIMPSIPMIVTPKG